IKFADNRDYHLTFASPQERQQFKDLLARVIKFQQKLESWNKEQIRNRSVSASQLQHPFAMSTRETVFQNRVSLGTTMDEPQGLSRIASVSFTSDMSNVMMDGSEYTGVSSTQVSEYWIQYTHWGQLKTRKMILHAVEKVVRLFGDRRKCTDEFAIQMIATIEVMNTVTLELVFTQKIKPMKMVFQSNNDLWYFVEQLRFLNANVLLHIHDANTNLTTVSLLDADHGDDNPVKDHGDDAIDTYPTTEVALKYRNPSIPNSVIHELNTYSHLFRYPVLRLIRTIPSRGISADKQITWKQHRRVIYLDMKRHAIRMKTVGEHLKEYHFQDITLLEKSYSNHNQLHMALTFHGSEDTQVRDYWYEFISPRAREEFVGRLVSAPFLAPLVSTSNNNDDHNGDDDELIPQIPSPIIRDAVTSFNTEEKKEELSSPRSLKGFSQDYSQLISNWKHKSTQINSSPLSLWIGSWNVAESEPDLSALGTWFPSADVESHDVYVIGLQECSTNLRKQWESALLKHISGQNQQYVLFHQSWILQIGCIVIIHRAHIAKISHLESQEVATGQIRQHTLSFALSCKGNVIGNKGAAVISFQFQETALCFICCHLSARAEKYEKRAKDVYRIIKMLSIGRPGLDVLHQFHHVFFFGDMNYRVEKDFDKVCDLIKKKKWTDIVQFDQLIYQMQRQQVFYGFKEGTINFAPTYRWERYDNIISNKREQAPSYCDRILYSSLSDTHDLKQLKYTSTANAFGSDHRPVWSVFMFTPRLPYFTNPFHFQILGQQYDPSQLNSISQNAIVENVAIELVDLKATFIGVPELLKDELHATLYHPFIEKPVLWFSGGSFESRVNAFSWPGIELEVQYVLRPYISDPEFLSHTHVFVEFVNISKSSYVIGYATISLARAFPIKLLTNIENSKQRFDNKIQADLSQQITSAAISNATPQQKENHESVLESDQINEKKEDKQDSNENKHNNSNNGGTNHSKTKPVSQQDIHHVNAPKHFVVPILLHGKFVGEVRLSFVSTLHSMYCLVSFFHGIAPWIRIWRWGSQYVKFSLFIEYFFVKISFFIL
ncbi:hypothetical protein RFI_21648, partial [Reticulomyxa filosa]